MTLANSFLKFTQWDYENLPSPLHLTDEVALESNLKVFQKIQDRTGAKILLALKAFAQFSLFPLIKKYLKGATASSLFEARLAKEEFGGEVHLYVPAYSPADWKQTLEIADSLVFNSISQWKNFYENIAKEKPSLSVGLRINPEYSEVKKELYNPCAKNSRMGVLYADFQKERYILSHLEGFHFHALCELKEDALERTWEAFEKKFGSYLSHLRWLNLGGGHAITAKVYNVDALCDLLLKIQKKYPNLQLYLEPGSAIAWETGVLQGTILDIVPTQEGIPVAMLDISFTAHMSDVLEGPYRPEVFTKDTLGALPNQKNHNYYLGGVSCLSGDSTGPYSFDRELCIGEKIYFADMSHYTMVKSTNFNGIRSPAIGIVNTENKKIEVVKEFEYSDYKSRLS